MTLTTTTARIVDEQRRLDALAQYDVLDTPPEEGFDRLTGLACRVLDVPMSTVAFLDGHRQWFKSRQGVTDHETDRCVALCDWTIRTAQPLVIPDTTTDARFRDNPLVVGPPHLRAYAGVPLQSPGGHNVGTICAMDIRPRDFPPEAIRTLEDLGRLATVLMDLRLQAATDPLTGTRSRSAFRREAERAVALALRHRQDLVCVMIDLDHFKAVNDTHGHAAGDEVLRACTEAFQRVLRSSDILGRVGGEEFAAILPLTGRIEGFAAAQRLRAAVSELRIPVGGEILTISASFGVAGLDRSVSGIDALLGRADAALYDAKAAGRDRCREWSPSPDALSNLRRRVFKAGRIAFNAGRSTIDCTVRAISERDALIDVTSTAGIPRAFKLQIEIDNISKACHVLSQQDRQLEVAFD